LGPAGQLLAQLRPLGLRQVLQRLVDRLRVGQSTGTLLLEALVQRDLVGDDVVRIDVLVRRGQRRVRRRAVPELAADSLLEQARAHLTRAAADLAELHLADPRALLLGVPDALGAAVVGPRRRRARPG